MNGALLHYVVCTHKAYHPQAQTPQQRKANERYARQEAAKRGKPESAIKQKQKWEPPISRLWIGTFSGRTGKDRRANFELIFGNRCASVYSLRGCYI